MAVRRYLELGKIPSSRYFSNRQSKARSGFTRVSEATPPTCRRGPASGLSSTPSASARQSPPCCHLTLVTEAAFAHYERSNARTSRCSSCSLDQRRKEQHRRRGHRRRLRQRGKHFFRCHHRLHLARGGHQQCVDLHCRSWVFSLVGLCSTLSRIT